MDYSTCIIYKIKCKDDAVSDVYVGCTFNLKQRKERHKSSCNNINSREYNYKIYQVVRANGGFENWTVEVVEEYKKCISLEDVRNKERYYIETLHANLNSYRPIITAEEKKELVKKWEHNNKEKVKQYYIDNKDKVKEQAKQYYIDNKDRVKEQTKQYHIDNKEKVKQYYIDNKEKVKQYYVDNKDKVKEQVKQYYNDNKNIYKEYMKEDQKSDKCKKYKKQYYINK